MEWTMKKIAIGFSAFAGIVLLSGCASGYYYGQYAYGYGYPSGYGVPLVRQYYSWNGVTYDCRYNYNGAFCGPVTLWRPVG
jgi:hypothetical protein